MRTVCPYCETEFDSSAAVCPSCGAPAPAPSEDGQAPRAGAVPATIDELKAFCASHRMPLEKMRFFIGEDYRGPRAFGIFRDADSSFVVYKNKSDGSRSIRYRGSDEAFAVREIYQKLKDEVALRRGAQSNSAYQSRASVSQSGAVRAPVRKKRGCLTLPVILTLLLLIGGIFVALRLDKAPTRGYYRYNSNYYYYQNDDWYYYSYSLLRWIAADTVDQELAEHPDEYYESVYYRDDYAIEDFSSTPFYESSDSGSSYSYSDRDDDDDDDWDYDYDDWDAGDTDWDSDW